MDSQDVLHFWFEETDPKDWFKNDGQLDEKIRERFLTAHTQAAEGELWRWRETIQGRLAEIILLDQFSRNIYRGEAKAFQYDGMALILSQEAIRTGQAEELPVQQRSFLYMPFMHSESAAIHETAMQLFAEIGMEESYRFEKAHRDIIEQFGRFPHRNKALGRPSTEEERVFMKNHSGF